MTGYELRTANVVPLATWSQRRRRGTGSARAVGVVKMVVAAVREGWASSAPYHPLSKVPRCPTCGTAKRHTVRFHRRRLALLLGATAVITMTIGMIVAIIGMKWRQAR